MFLNQQLQKQEYSEFIWVSNEIWVRLYVVVFLMLDGWFLTILWYFLIYLRGFLRYCTCRHLAGKWLSASDGVNEQLDWVASLVYTPHLLSLRYTTSLQLVNDCNWSTSHCSPQNHDHHEKCKCNLCLGLSFYQYLPTCSTGRENPARYHPMLATLSDSWHWWVIVRVSNTSVRLYSRPAAN